MTNSFKYSVWFKYQNNSMFRVVQQGVLMVTEESVSLVRDDGSPVFKLRFDEIKKVSINLGRFMFIGPSKKYYITLYDLTRQSVEAGKVPGAILPFYSRKFRPNYGLEVHQQDTQRLKRILESNHVKVSGSGEGVNEKDTMLIVSILFGALLVFLIVVAVLAPRTI